MTEAGEKWVEARFPEAFKALKNGRYAVEDFWLRAFCDEVERRAREELGSTTANGIGWFLQIKGKVLAELKRDLLGETK